MLNRQRPETVLLENGLISNEQLKIIRDEQKATGMGLSKVLIEKQIISEDQLLDFLEEYYNIPRFSLSGLVISREVIEIIPADLAKRHRLIPLAVNEGQVTVAMADPLDLTAIDDLTTVTGLEITPVAARESSINYMVTQYYSLADATNHGIVVKEEKGAVEYNNYREEIIHQDSEDAPIIRMVDSLIERAIDEGASDIHLEPSDDSLRVRMRIDGALNELTVMPGQVGIKMISRIKIMANLDIAEKRLAQDGNIEWNSSCGNSSLRVSSLPTIQGEKIVIRLLEKNKTVLPLEQLGFTQDNYQAFLGLLLNHAGLILVTGPTGCGKTTTLYSALNYINRPEDNIITVEDPVEYRLKGINQVQINPRIKHTFANVLRSILRQDPDVIMVGEIRDLETAKITTQAAFTGHLVLSTLHTNNASGAVARLIDMGLDNYVVTASLVGVIAQRLVRKICTHCKQTYYLSEEEKKFFKRYFKIELPEKLTKGKKCRNCNFTGYRGRTSIQEVMVMDQELQEIILQGASMEILQQKAVERGMIPLIHDGLRCVDKGITTLNEVLRSTFSSIIESNSYESDENNLLLERLYRDNE